MTDKEQALMEEREAAHKAAGKTYVAWMEARRITDRIAGRLARLKKNKRRSRYGEVELGAALAIEEEVYAAMCAATPSADKALRETEDTEMET